MRNDHSRMLRADQISGLETMRTNLDRVRARAAAELALFADRDYSLVGCMMPTDPVWMSSGYVDKSYLDDANPEDDFIKQQMKGHDHLVVTLDSVVENSLQVGVERQMDSMTRFGDGFDSFVPGPQTTTVTFTTSDQRMVPGRRIIVQLPQFTAEPVMIMRTHRRGGLIDVEATSVRRDYGVNVDYDQIGIGKSLDRMIRKTVASKQRLLDQLNELPAHPNCRCTNIALTEAVDAFLKGRKTMTLKNEKTPRFYVGSRQAVTRKPDGTVWAKYTEKEAIAHATELVEKTGEEQFIVKVIKVVRRKPQPIIVETVK